MARAFEIIGRCNGLRKAITLCSIFVLVLLTSLLVGVQTVQAQYPWLSVHIETRSATTYVNQPVQFTAFVSGGTPPYSYQWYSRLYPDGEPLAGAMSPTFTFTSSSPGTYVIDFIATDSLNAQAGYLPPPITVTVFASPTSSPSTPTQTPTPTPTPTSTLLPSPTPMPLFDGSMAYPITAVIVIIVVVAIAAVVLFRRQRPGSIEKTKI